MNIAHRRPKQPEAVRRSLLDCAERLLLERGSDGLTIQAVAEAAGVTKGGLLHHYPSRQALANALFQDLIDELDDRLDRAMASDPRRPGRFTRAYVDAVLGAGEFSSADPYVALWTAMFADAGLRSQWRDWLDQRLTQHRDTDCDPSLALVRYMVDGVWLADVTGEPHHVAMNRVWLRAKLIAMTKGPAPR